MAKKKTVVKKASKKVVKDPAKLAIAKAEAISKTEHKSLPIDDFLKKQKDELNSSLEQLNKIASPNAMGVSNLFAHFIKDVKHGHHTIEWMAEAYWGLRVQSFIERLNRIYDKLVEDGHDVDNPFEFNDLDDEIWFEKTAKNLRVMPHTAQSINHLYVWSAPAKKPILTFNGIEFNASELHIRRYYDRFDDPRFERTTDKHEIEDEKEIKALIAKKGRTAIVKLADGYIVYADDDKIYPKRLSLDYYRKKKFKFEYGDARDNGYILSWNYFMSLVSPKVDHAISTHRHLATIDECDLPSMLNSLFDEENW